MALIKADRVKETSTSTGATTFALAGAVVGFQAFSSVCSVGDTFFYVIDSDSGSEWETGLGTYSATNTLTRTTVYASSNSGSIVTFSAGTKNVYISLTGRQINTISAAPPAATGSQPRLIDVTGAAHTAITASTEYNDVYFNLDRTVQFSNGTITSQRAVRIDAPTYSFVTAGTIFDAVTFEINGEPKAGANATISRQTALKVNSAGYGIVSSVSGTYPSYEAKDSFGNSLYYVASDGSVFIGGDYYPVLDFDAILSVSGPNNKTGISINIGSVTKSLIKAYGVGTASTCFEVKGQGQLICTPTAATSQTASTERTDAYFNLSRTVQFATGSIATQRAIRISAPTYSFVGASTINNAATVQIDGPPIAGTNATISERSCFRVLPNAGSKGIVVRSQSFGQSGNSIETQDYLGRTFFNVTSDYGLLRIGGTLVTHQEASAYVSIGQATSAGTALSISNNVSGNENDAINIYNISGAKVFQILGHGSISVAPSAMSSGTRVPAETITGAAHTALTASTEYSDIYWNFARTVQFATGAITTQRAVRIAAPTYSFVAASTITNAATIQIDSAPVAGANATITNAIAFRVLTGVAAAKGIVVQGAASQTGNLQEWQNSSGTVLSAINSAGSFTGTAANVSGTIAIANGGTGQTTAANAINALLPTQTSNSGKFLTTNGTVSSWATVSASPAGSSGQVQYNLSGSFAGAAKLIIQSSGYPTNTSNSYPGNSGFGWSVFNNLNSGIGNTAFGTDSSKYLNNGNNNCSFGINSLINTISGGGNCSFGSDSLSYADGYENCAFGSASGYSYGSSSNSNTCIGAYSGFSGSAYSGNGSNSTIIGYYAQPSSYAANNEVTLGNSSVSTLRCQVTSITSLSDRRDKTNIQPMPSVLSFIASLNPVQFDWWTRDGAKIGVPDYGFIAQELQQAQSSNGFDWAQLVYESNPEKLEASPGKLIPILVKAIQELAAKVAALEAAI